MQDYLASESADNPRCSNRHPKTDRAPFHGRRASCIRLDRLRGHRFLVDEIVDVSMLLVKNPDIPSNPKIVTAVTAGGQWTAVFIFFEKDGLFCKSVCIGKNAHSEILI
jgi:hypothetical protein